MNNPLRRIWGDAEYERRLMLAAVRQKEFLTGKKWRALRVLPDDSVELVEVKD